MFKYKMFIYTYLMNSIHKCIKHSETSNLHDILIANETNPEPFSCQEITGDIMDSVVKISVDPIKVFQKAGLKFSDIVLEKYNTLSTNMNRLGVKELHDLSPLQYPLFTEVKSENSSLLKTAIVIGGSIAFILLLRNKNIDVSEKNIDSPKELSLSEKTKNSLENEEAEIVEKEISCLSKKNHLIDV
jgi:hypothetical protein